jgi:hypothetical protein
MVFTCTAVFGQSQVRDAYMVPPKVYLGDRASLVLPLPGYSGGGDAEILPARIPSSQDIDIHRVALERRPGGSRLVIEFSAYTPGFLELPPLEIAGEIFSGLKIEISSILDSSDSDMVLSPPVPPLAVPGTSLLVYGSISAVLLSLLLALWILFGEHRWVHTRLAAWKRRRLIIAMLRIEKRLRKALIRGEDCREMLDTLSVEFRSFLAWFTGENCRAMTAVELGGLGSLVALPSEESQVSYTDIGGIFSRCDNARFSGREINNDEALTIFDDVERFLTETAA